MNKNQPFYIIGNWKSNETIDEAVAWWQDFSYLWKKNPPNTQNLKIILCPSFIHLTTIKSLIELSDIPMSLGVQDLSPFPSGPYTAENSANMLKGLVKYSIIGHSERRKYFGEKDDELKAEVEQAIKAGIEPIYCIQDDKMSFPKECNIVAYEPVWAIGTGKPETAENANQVAKNIKAHAHKQLAVIYGGSVTSENVSSYVNQEDISGVLPGGASLDPKKFIGIIANAK